MAADEELWELRSDPVFVDDVRHIWPTAMGAPEFASFIRDEADEEDCFSRRPELAHLCLERADEDFALMRRAPECPDEFACPNEGCV